MARGIVRVILPIATFAVTSVGVALAARLASRDQGGSPALEVHRPLPAEGWWSRRDSSPLAYAHPAVLFIDVASGTLVDSWDRRTHARVERPVVRWSSEWPDTGVIVVDAVTGDLLVSLASESAAPSEGMARG